MRNLKRQDKTAEPQKTTNHALRLRQKIKNRSAVVGIIGMGYVGLPLAVEFCRAGFKVIGIDINPTKVKLLSAGKSDVDDVKSSQVKKLVGSGMLRVTNDFDRLTEADCISICVPTPLNKTKDPDVSYILAASTEIQKRLRPGQLVVLESTTYPGTTEELILPLLLQGGLKVGIDFFLAFSPERVDPGNPKFTTRNTPKIVGGVTPDCTALAVMLYDQVVTKVIPVSSTKAAEMVKLLENTFRSVNIGLVNEVALMCDRLQIDVWEVIDAAATKPFGFMPFYPGPGLGGHCIPIDPHYLSWKLRSLNYYARFIELAGDINSRMPEYVAEKITLALNNQNKPLRGSKILILGVAYKRDISDVRESPALDVIKILQQRGAKVSYNDPYVPSIRLDGDQRMQATPLSAAILAKSDCVVIVTDHSKYNYQWIVDNSRLVFDTRNATRNIVRGREKVRKL